jgi:hypothetical protein
VDDSRVDVVAEQGLIGSSKQGKYSKKNADLVKANRVHTGKEKKGDFVARAR